MLSKVRDKYISVQLRESTRLDCSLRLIQTNDSAPGVVCAKKMRPEREEEAVKIDSFVDETLLCFRFCFYRVTPPMRDNGIINATCID